MALYIADPAHDAADIGDWHVNGPQQSDDSRRTGLPGAEAPRGRDQLKAVVPPELRDTQAHQLRELPDLKSISFVTHEAILAASPA